MLRLTIRYLLSRLTSLTRQRLSSWALELSATEKCSNARTFSSIRQLTIGYRSWSLTQNTEFPRAIASTNCHTAAISPSQAPTVLTPPTPPVTAPRAMPLTPPRPLKLSTDSPLVRLSRCFLLLQSPLQLSLLSTIPPSKMVLSNQSKWRASR